MFKYTKNSHALLQKLIRSKEKFLTQIVNSDNDEANETADILIDDLLATADRIRHIEKLESERRVPSSL